ncbi:histidine kinase [Erysipelothrix rhusiopathiae]|nr:histidine kinase [Erysipelothrix rhusiopathiae]
MKENIFYKINFYFKKWFAIKLFKSIFKSFDWLFYLQGSEFREDVSPKYQGQFCATELYFDIQKRIIKHILSAVGRLSKINIAISCE